MKPAAQSDLYDLKKKVAIVSGGAMGIGAAIAARLAEAGACVSLADVDLDEATRVASAIQAKGCIARAFPCDVARVSDVRAVVRGTVEAFGGVDILVNNAGIFPISPALETAETVFDRVLDVNLKGAFFFAQAAAQEMVKHGEGGAIVNIASVDALHPAGGLAHYDASKGGLVMLTHSLALELAPKRIRVNVICPGAIQTPGTDAALSAMSGGDKGRLKAAFTGRIPLGRMGDADDVARAALFLVSKASSYITGASLVVDGGYLLA